MPRQQTGNRPEHLCEQNTQNTHKTQCNIHFFLLPPPSPLYMYIGVGVGWPRRCKTCKSLRGLDKQGTVFFLLIFGGHHDGYRVGSYCAGWIILTPHKGNHSITKCEYGQAPTTQLHSNTHCRLWSGHTRKQSNSLALSPISKKVGTRCRSPFYERFLEGRSSPFLRLAEHLTALRAWCKQCLPGW